MYPNDILHALIDRDNWIQVSLVEVLVDTPHMLFFFLIELQVKALKIVEEGSEHFLVVLQKQFHLFLRVEHGNAVEVRQYFNDFLLFCLVLYEDAWPADPNSFYDHVTLLQVEKMVIEDTFGSLDNVLASHCGVLYNNYRKLEGDYYQFLLNLQLRGESS